MQLRGFRSWFLALLALILLVGAANVAASLAILICPESLEIDNKDVEQCQLLALSNARPLLGKDLAKAAAPDYNAEQVAVDYGAFAAMASNAYGAQVAFPAFQIGDRDFTPAELLGSSPKKSVVESFGGYYREAFVGERLAGKKREVVGVFVIRGTDGFAGGWLGIDLLSNLSYLTQMWSPWDQYKEVREDFAKFRREVLDKNPGVKVELTVVGHSLGGGLARHVAAAFPCVTAITFNASFVSNEFRLAKNFLDQCSKRGAPCSQDASRVVSLFEDNDPLSFVGLHLFPKDYLYNKAQSFWFDLKTVANGNQQKSWSEVLLSQHNMYFIATAMSRIPVDCMRRDDCVFSERKPQRWAASPPFARRWCEVVEPAILIRARVLGHQNNSRPEFPGICVHVRGSDVVDATAK